MMHNFTVRLPRGPTARLFGRNPLLRTSDRVEALVLVLAVVMSLLFAPIAAAVGTAVYDSRRQLYAEQAHTRHSVTATVIDDNAAQDVSLTTITMAAEWSAAGAEHTGTVKAASTTKSGDLVEIWVDDNGARDTAASMHDCGRWSSHQGATHACGPGRSLSGFPRCLHNECGKEVVTRP